MEIKITEQKCSKCHETKPIDEFRKCKANKSGFMLYCKFCHSEASKKNYQENRENRIAMADMWNSENYHKVLRSNEKYRKKKVKEQRKLNTELKNHPEMLDEEIVDKIEEGESPSF